MIEDNVKETGRASTYEGRLNIIGETVCKQMSLMYIAHTHLRTAEASGFFLQQSAETINRAMPTHLNDAQFMDAMREVWRELTALHKSKYWPSIHEIGKAATKVGARLARREDKINKAFSGTFEAEQQAREEEKKKPETIEGWLDKLKMTDDMIADGSLNRGMGITLRKIACAALARLGYEGDTSLQGIGETPPEHLPEPVSNVTQTSQEPAPIAKPIMSQDSGELNMRLLKAGMTAPKFDNQPDDFDDPLPDNMQGDMPSFDSL